MDSIPSCNFFLLPNSFFSPFLIGFPLQKIEARKSSQKKLTEALRSHIDRSELNFPQKINIVDTCTLCIILL